MTEDQNINQLPKEWKWVKLGEACEIVSGNTPKGLELISNKGKFQFYKVSDMNLVGNEIRMNVSNLKLTIEEIKKLKVKVYPKGTVIFPKRGGAILTNKKRVLSQDASFDLNVMGILPNDKLSSNYLFYWIQKLDLSKIYDGSNVPQINNKNIAPLDFPLPPKPAQQAIVSKIEELFSELDKGIESLRTAQQQLKIYRQSILSAGTSGMLTATHNTYLNSITIGQPTKLNRNWNAVKLIDVAKLESGHTPRKDTPAYWENGNVLWLSLQDIRALDGKIATNTKYKTNELGIKNSSARLLPEGTVCFCRDISVGYVTIMGKVMSTTQHFANWICTDELNNKFLMYSFMASRDSLIRQGQGTTVKTIYMPDLKEMRIQLPSVKEQNKIVQQIESRLSIADKIAESITQGLQQAEVLRQSILKKAFEGRLL